MKEKSYKLDKEIREFLQEIRSGQSADLAAWAGKIARRGRITEAELAKLFGLGF